MKRLIFISAILPALLLGACAVNPNMHVLESASAVELRSYQTRAFDTTDNVTTLRTVMSTLQDLGFVIDKADATLGSVSATKLDEYEMRISVTVRARGEAQILVRANAQHGLAAVETPQLYQDFFVALEKSMFLAAHAVD